MMTWRQLLYCLLLIQAMVVTASRHSPEEIALRALPSLGPLTVDPVAEVEPSLSQQSIAASHT